MAVLTGDEFFNALHERIGNDTSDEAIAFFENMTDTYNALEDRARGSTEDWERRYRDLDESWKRRYMHRFMTGCGGTPYDETTDDDVAPEDVTIDELFKEG